MEQNAVRKLVSYATALTLLGSPLSLSALGLGRLVVNSPIDTPLAAEIELTALGAADLGTIEVELASRQEFDNATIERSQILQQLQFQVDRRDDNTPIIRVTSSEAIGEPFLQFLITVQWPGGKLIREYTALLDPPLYAGAQNRNNVDAPQAGGSVESTESQVIIESEVVEVEAIDSSADQQQIVTGTTDNTVYSGSLVTTRSGDTLTEIASTLPIPDGVNIYQAMLAIQQANPSAFINGNMNRLKRGVELNIPDLSTGVASAAEARRAFAAQLAEFERFRQGVASSAPTQVPQAQPTAPVADAAGEQPAPATPQPTESAAVPAATPAQQPAETTAGAAGSTGTVTTDGELKITKAEAPENANERTQLLSQLSQAEEQVSALDAENRELRERLTLLESKVEQSTRLAQIEQSRLAELEAQAKATAKAREDAKKNAEADAERERLEQAAKLRNQQAEEQRLAAELAQQQLDQQQQPADTETTTEAVVDNATQAGTAVTETADAAAQQVAEGGTSFLETAKSKVNNLLGRDDAGVQDSAATSNDAQQGGEGLAGKATGLFGSFGQTIKSFLAGSWAMMGAFGLIVMGLIGLIIWRRRRSIAEFEESILSGSALDIQTDTAETGTASTAATDTSFLSEFGVPGMGGMQTDEVDPIAEAEVYMAYGRDEQAEEVLKEAINRDSRPELKLKLLEIYRSRNEVKEFETLAEELYPAHGNEPDEVWRKVVEMGQQVSPSNPLFKGGVVAASAAAVGAAMAGGGVAAGSANAYSPNQQPEAVSPAAAFEEADAVGAVDSFPQPQADTSVNAEIDQLTAQAELANPSLEAFQLNDIERSQQGDTAELSTETRLDDGLDYETEAGAGIGGASSGSTVADDVLNLRQPENQQNQAEAALAAQSSLDDGIDFELNEDVSMENTVETSVASSVGGVGAGLAAAGAAVTGAGAAAVSGLGSKLSGAGSDATSHIGEASTDAKENVRDLFSQDVGSLPDDLSLGSLTDADTGVDTIELDNDDASLTSILEESSGSFGGSDANDTLGLDIDGLSFDTADEAELRLSEAASNDTEDVFNVAGSDGDSDNATKLDLAKAYRDMGDDIGARGFLEEVIKNGSDQQRKEATELMSQIESA